MNNQELYWIIAFAEPPQEKNGQHMAILNSYYYDEKDDSLRVLSQLKIWAKKSLIEEWTRDGWYGAKPHSIDRAPGWLVRKAVKASTLQLRKALKDLNDHFGDNP